MASLPRGLWRSDSALEPLFVSGKNEWSYDHLHAEARAVAKGLIAAGVVKGARVGVLMANRPEWVAASMGASMVGAVVVPINTYASPSERDYILRHGDVSTLLLQRSLLKHEFLQDFLRDHPDLATSGPGGLRSAELPQLRRVYCLGLDEGKGGIEAWPRLLERGSKERDDLLDACIAEIEPSDDSLIIYTSGTTARPKGVAHRQRAAVVQSWRFAELMDLSPEDRVYSAQPFFWTAGIAMSLGATLAAGGTLILQESFDPEAALACIERERATTVHAWPHQEKSMAEHPSAASRDLRSVRHVEFTSPLAKVIPIEVDEWGIYGSYGLSETFTLATATHARAPADLRHHTNGPALPGNTVRIVDPESGGPMPEGEKGEVAVKGPTLMSGYYKVEPENAFDEEGFFRTQDGGWIDADGNLHWKGRLSNLIKTGGANVSPLEIEAALADYPGIKTAHAVGVPHPTLGEIIVLCAVPTATAESLAPVAIQAYLKERVASYKVPRFVVAIAPGEVEYTGTQKVQQEPLRALALAALDDVGFSVAGHTYGV